MYRYFTAKRTRRYVDVLPDLVHSYNNTHHRSVGTAPMEVTADNEGVVRERLYPPKPKTLRWKFNVGDKVRISMQRRPFKKGYVGNWFARTVRRRHSSAHFTGDVQIEGSCR